ncbi:MAG: transposase [Bryobacterales bacterium]|nr:transposase [Bryobacterales bacterium]
MLLAYADGRSVSWIARRLGTNRARVERCVDKGLRFGALAALEDLPRQRRPGTITPEARAWVVALARARPADVGRGEAGWTTRLLADHVRSHCEREGHPSLVRLSAGTVSKILARTRPRRPEPGRQGGRAPTGRTAQVLLLCKVLPLARAAPPDCGERGAGAARERLTVLAPCDWQPGMAPGHPAAEGRDGGHRRPASVTLSAGLDLRTGRIHRAVEERHGSRQFVRFLRRLDRAYPAEIRIRLVLDKRVACVTPATSAYLGTRANRFEFIFAPAQGSWLNLVESVFAHLTSTLLRGIQAESKEQLRQHIEAAIDRLNQAPLASKWPYRLDEMSLA